MLLHVIINVLSLYYCAMRFPDSGKFPDFFQFPKIEILRIGNVGKESGEGVGGSCQITWPDSQILKV
jgi:hypothetical protein